MPSTAACSFSGRAEIKDALSLSAHDRLPGRSFIPADRKRAKAEFRRTRRMEFLKDYARRSMAALSTTRCGTILTEPIFKGTKARQFVSLIEAFSADYGRHARFRAAVRCLNESGYEEMLRTEGSQERLDNLAELKQSVYEYETTCGEESRLEHYLAHVATVYKRRSGTNTAIR